MTKQNEPLELPKKKHDKDVVINIKKELKKRSKSELINIIINLSAKIDELKEEKEDV